MAIKHPTRSFNPSIRRAVLLVLALLLLIPVVKADGAMLYKNYIVRYDRGWDILCDPYEVKRGDWVLKIFRQKGEIAHADFRKFLGIFQRLNPHVKDIDRIRPGQVVDIPLKRLSQGTLPGQSSGVVTIPFVMISNPTEMIQKHTTTYTIQSGDTVSQLVAKQFGGRYGNTTYNQGLKLFKTANPHIKDVNRIYAGQKIYIPDPSIREQAWYSSLFDQGGAPVTQMDDTTAVEATEPPSEPALATAPAVDGNPPETDDTEPVASAAAAIGGSLLNKGTYFFPMKQGKEFELDLSRYPMIDLQNGSKVILTTQDQVMNVDLPLVQSYWDNIKVVKVPESASSQEILNGVFSAFSGESTTNHLAFDDDSVTISVIAKWIRTELSADGTVPRHTCITPIMDSSQRTHDTIVRYLDQNDIIIKEILAGSADSIPAPPSQVKTTPSASIDSANQKFFMESFAVSMGFHYSPNISISFPYAGIQVSALSNLLSFGNGREILVDFGDLYGDAVNAIRDTGLEILQINAESGPMEIIQQLMETAGMAYTPSPTFYGADRPSEFNTAITVNGILIPTDGDENRLYVEGRLPELIEVFIRERSIRLILITDTSRG